jgi:hypothetical protein
MRAEERSMPVIAEVETIPMEGGEGEIEVIEVIER